MNHILRIVGIDPGSSQSAMLVYYPERRSLQDGPRLIAPNEEILAYLLSMQSLTARRTDLLAIEYMRPRGMPTSKEEMDTQFWAGRFVQAWGAKWRAIYRQDVKIRICGSSRAKDSNIRQALIDRWGGKDAAVGKKANPGPLYGIKRDLWSALAIAVTAAEILHV